MTWPRHNLCSWFYDKSVYKQFFLRNDTKVQHTRSLVNKVKSKRINIENKLIYLLTRLNQDKTPQNREHQSKRWHLAKLKKSLLIELTDYRHFLSADVSGPFSWSEVNIIPLVLAPPQKVVRHRTGYIVRNNRRMNWFSKFRHALATWGKWTRTSRNFWNLF